MGALSFYKWSPGGNTTLLFPGGGRVAAEQAALAAAALDGACLGGEQAGFLDADRRHLRMAGGEFCVNAGRAAGAQLALLAAEGGRRAPEGAAWRGELRVSGWESPLRLMVRGAAPHWLVEAWLRLPPCPVEAVAPDACLVRLPGISHLLLKGAPPAAFVDCQEQAALWRRRLGLDREAAAGVIWWWGRGSALGMRPLVRVRDAATEILENACGSGALALALSLAGHRKGRRDFAIAQPSGTVLAVRLCGEGGAAVAGIDGPVDLVARGEAWLPAAAAGRSPSA